MPVNRTIDVREIVDSFLDGWMDGWTRAMFFFSFLSNSSFNSNFGIVLSVLYDKNIKQINARYKHNYRRSYSWLSVRTHFMYDRCMRALLFHEFSMHILVRGYTIHTVVCMQYAIQSHIRSECDFVISFSSIFLQFGFESGFLLLKTS